MSPAATVVLVAVGGGAGATLRYLLATRLDARWPRGTLLANVTGSGLLGLLVAAGVDDPAYPLLGVGLCGGLTTWSSYAVQSHRLGREDGARAGTAYALGTLALALAACAAGFWLGSRM
ncbi:fluoride efflux transporter FluC [Nocardioides sp. SYSU DS0663]|uniref:fluoride efflux transporter FluC n=1 Tax=Nocardioides sp. SYSU DS0663 TaxID=3416445 RepID=UPI003F4C0487